MFKLDEENISENEKKHVNEEINEEEKQDYDDDFWDVPQKQREPEKPLVVITGVSGYIGSHVCL